MKEFNIFLTGLIYGFSFFLLIYLVCCFGCATFDISKWEQPARGFCAFSGLISIISITGAYCEHKTRK